MGLFFSPFPPPPLGLGQIARPIVDLALKPEASIAQFNHRMGGQSEASPKPSQCQGFSAQTGRPRHIQNRPLRAVFSPYLYFHGDRVGSRRGRRSRASQSLSRSSGLLPGASCSRFLAVRTAQIYRLRAILSKSGAPPGWPLRRSGRPSTTTARTSPRGPKRPAAGPPRPQVWPQAGSSDC